MVHVIDHPLVQHKLSIMRDKNTGSKEFRELLNEIGMLVAYEVTRDLPLQDVEVETPICKCTTKMLAGRKLGVVPILRAGLGMVSGFQKLLPFVRIGHIGLARNEETHEPEAYYYKMPQGLEAATVIVVDPMLATGGSACDAIAHLKQNGAKTIKFACLIASNEGLARLHREHPDVAIYAAECDPVLNDRAYIVPGLGDAGDRIFGTN